MADDAVEVALPVSLHPGELWELMWRGTLVTQWLGAGSVLPARSGHRLVLSDRAGTWRRGRVVRVDSRSGSVEAMLDRAEGWPAQPGENLLRLAISRDPDDSVWLRITETGPYVDAHRAEVELYWRAVIDRLKALLDRVRRRRTRPRQAIVVIHGIGEQEPGRTLRTLVASGVIGAAEASSYVKPDRASESFELRQVTFAATRQLVAPTTDVYELYWAHLIRDTTVGQVLGWARRLLLRRGVPRPLLPAWIAVWILVLAVVVTAGGQLFGLWVLPRWLTAGGVVLAVAALLWRLVAKGVVVNVLGDAARYLSPHPTNVANRQAVRQAGVDLLERLHRRGVYDRIVVLGHSLGSVIAYDVVTYSWIQLHGHHQRPARPGFGPLRDLERGIAGSLSPEVAQDLQHAAWQQVRRNTQPWLVTDLVTVGSPLTYAGFLMARTAEEFGAAQDDRILPRCPPCTEVETRSGFNRCSYETNYTSDNGDNRPRPFTVFHHGAPFAVTRWTNLYFPVRWAGLRGDIVGGPVSGQFGPWVRDVAVPSPVRWFAHTSYWKATGDRAHLDALRQALGPECGAELRGLSYEIPAYVIAARASADRP